MSTVHEGRQQARSRLLDPTVLFGLALIVAGLLLLLDRLEVLDAGRLAADWWPLVIVGIGVWWLFADSRLAGLAAIAVGVVLLGVVHDVVEGNVGNLIFPAVLVLIGAGALTAGARMRRAMRGLPAPDGSWTQAPTAMAVFGDARLSVADDGTDHAAVTAISVFGDVEVAVPAGWRVVDRTTALLGTVRIPQAQPTYAEAPVVELHGLAIFGDAKVRYLDDPRSV
ncbi:LiaI-LiaF-like domain-containing protein [Egicoccus sp. AB-alg2]|uniref:LiaF transmembrane domain-containing protein n=1 Tax=Egicoccus sp. AB-alg2 TaxID=3242693 RepID=UPI00359E72B9